MALEAVVFPQDPLSYAFKDLHSLVGAAGGEELAWGDHYDYVFKAQEAKSFLGNFTNHIEKASLHTNWDSSCPSLLQNNVKDQLETNYSSPEACTAVDQSLPGAHFSPTYSMEAPASAPTVRRKRRRTKSAKNKEEIENQRMTHIAVERNRRKQMNEYLAVLRSLMPPSYVQRGDQASIIGGAINFVKELEQLLQSMEGQKWKNRQQSQDNSDVLSEFFTFPQYSTRANQSNPSPTSNTATTTASEPYMGHNQWAAADIEVTLVDGHANLKILSKKRPRQLLKMVVGLQSLRLTILHLNVTTLENMVLYSVSVKLEEGCQLNTVDEIASAVNQLSAEA